MWTIAQRERLQALKDMAQRINRDDAKVRVFTGVSIHDNSIDIDTRCSRAYNLDNGTTTWLHDAVRNLTFCREYSARLGMDICLLNREAWPEPIEYDSFGTVVEIIELWLRLIAAETGVTL